MEKNKLKDSLKRLEEIINWFDEQEEIDVESSLEIVKEGAGLIKESRENLKKLENQFIEIKKELTKNQKEN
jgi:exodeoxyribonuclease VII small subunit